MGRRYCSCINCKEIFSTNNIEKHFKRCLKYGSRFNFIKKEWDGHLECLYCSKLCKNRNSIFQHEIRCSKNENRIAIHVGGFSGKSKTAWNKGLTKETSEAVKQYSIKNSINKKGKPGRRLSEETKEKLSIKACERLQKNSKYTKNVEYKPGIWLESSYEVRFAEILDDFGIEWERVRKGYIWNDNGKTRRYVPDFYLPKYEFFVDTKNDYLIKIDKQKIKSAQELNDIKVVVLANNQINSIYVKFLLNL